MKNKWIKITILAIVILGALPFSFSVTQNQTDATLGVAASNNPNITDLNTDAASYDPTANGTTTVSIWFLANDGDGYLNLDNTTAELHTNRSASLYGNEWHNNTSCTVVNVDWDTNNYTCTIVMNYYDVNGAWDINVSIKDDEGNFVNNTTETFTYNSLTAMGTNKSSIDFGSSLNIGQQDVAATDDPIGVYNFGNQNLTKINVTAIGLQGQTHTNYYIPASSFETDTDDVADDSTALVNNTPVQIIDPTPVYINRGNGTNESLYFHVDIPSSNIQVQTYNTTGAGTGAWTIAVED
ncbi:MAG: hypothetical protein R6U26_02940 [Candidatus Undinarchaeales archaeon]